MDLAPMFAVIVLGVVVFAGWTLYQQRKRARLPVSRASGGGGSGRSLDESLKTKKDLSYYYAHSRGNKASDVDIDKIGKRGGYGIGAPALISRTPSRSVGGGAASATPAGGAASSPRRSVLEQRAVLAAPLRNYSWEDAGKFVKIHVDFPEVGQPGAVAAALPSSPAPAAAGADAMARPPPQPGWGHALESTATSLLLLLEREDGGGTSASGTSSMRHKLQIPALFGKVGAATAVRSKSGKRLIVKLKKQNAATAWTALTSTAPSRSRKDD